MRLGFVDCWFVEILGSHNSYIDDGEAPSDVTKMMADYDIKSSDGEDSNISNLSNSRTSPQTTEKFIPMPTTPNFLRPENGAFPFQPPSTAASMLASGQYPLNIPMFPESYLMTVARNAAAVAAMNSSQSNPLSPLGLNSLKRGQSPSDVIMPEIMNGYLPSPIIPRFGLMPNSVPTTPIMLDNGHHHLNSSSTSAIDLSTPKMSPKAFESDDPQDLSMNSSRSSPKSNVTSKFGNDSANNIYSSRPPFPFASDIKLNPVDYMRSTNRHISEKQRLEVKTSPNLNSHNIMNSSLSVRTQPLFPKSPTPTVHADTNEIDVISVTSDSPTTPPVLSSPVSSTKSPSTQQSKVKEAVESLSRSLKHFDTSVQNSALFGRDPLGLEKFGETSSLVGEDGDTDYDDLDKEVAAASHLVHLVKMSTVTLTWVVRV